MSIKIEQALNTKLVAYAAPLDIPVKWDFYNDGDEPSIDGIHFRQNQLKAASTIVGIEDTGSNDHSGIYQVMVCGKRGEPSGALKTEVDNVLAEFKRGQQLSYGGVNLVLENAYASDPLYSEAYVKVPVSINYRAFISN